METKKRETLKNAGEFLELNTFGIIGVSSNTHKFGNNIFRELIAKNYKVYQIHNLHKILNNHECYSNPVDIPEKIEGLIISVRKDRVKQIINDYHNQGIENFWIQQGSESSEVKEFCKERKIKAVHGKCILMFAQPVNSIHKVHRTLWNWFGRS
ncbi:MAG: CoA-binding protein [Candidatus Kapaibacterium sp.]|jgi:predicted CoA-binding protein|nr:CoA-binding protein [Candidatus Kapabacteria bacterium]